MLTVTPLASADGLLRHMKAGRCRAQKTGAGNFAEALSVIRAKPRRSKALAASPGRRVSIGWMATGPRWNEPVALRHLTSSGQKVLEQA